MIRVQSQYMGSLPYWAAILQSEAHCMDVHAFFEKQSYRNRTIILGPNGLQSLVVPIYGRNKKQAMLEVRISDEIAWQRNHLNSLQTAYRSAPYYEYIYPELEKILLQNHTHLAEFNAALHAFFIKRLKHTLPKESVSYDLIEGELDKRELFHPKKEKELLAPYSQVFQEKLGFVSGAGIIDLLMNELPNASTYLKQLVVR